MTSSCSFYSFKWSVQAHIDNITISPIINNSTEYTAVEILDREIYDTLLKENVLKLSSLENAKSRLDITIKDITDKAYTYNTTSSSSFEQVEEWRITIKAEVIWFDIKEDSPYMLLVSNILNKKKIPMSENEKKLFGIQKLNIKRSDIPAVTHIDNSARVQTVDKKTNPFNAIRKYSIRRS